MATRALTTRNIFEMKHTLLPLQGIWKEALGDFVENNGIWIIYGREKNGKSTFALQLAKHLNTIEPVYYISAEEGYSVAFRNAIQRAGIDITDTILWEEYIGVETLVKKLKQRKSRNIIFIDNLTVYGKEFDSALITKLPKLFPKKLFVFIAHERRKEPTPSNAEHAKKLASLIVRVEGLRCMFSGRYASGVVMKINAETSTLIFGTNEET